MSSASPPQLVADRYRLLQPLGQGGMGRVWKARDEVLHRDVAIKELVPPPGLTDDERREMRERSLREARAIARLNHANVVRVFDVLRTDGDPWIVMEYVPSRSLQDAIAADGPLPPARVAEIGIGVLGALRAAHRAGVIHRDVKPGNVLLGEDGRVVLTDFGLATVPGDPNVTRTGLVLGSPAYIAPERARDGTALPEGDLWSLGATLYAAAEGQSPFARPSAIGTLSALATEPVPPPRNAGPLKAVLLALLEKDPAARANAETAERMLRRVAGRRGRPSLLDGVRRAGPNGGRREDRPRAVPTPLPAPRQAPGPAEPGQEYTPGRSPVGRPPAGPTEVVPPAPTEVVSPAPTEVVTPAAAAAGAASSSESTGSGPASPTPEHDQERTGPAEADPTGEPASTATPAAGETRAAASEADVTERSSAPVIVPAPRNAPAAGPLSATRIAPLPATAERTGSVYPGQRSGNRRNWLIGGLVAVVLLALLALVPLFSRDSDDPDRQAGPGPSNPAGQTAGPTGDPAQTPAGTPTSQAPSPTASPSAGNDQPVIPPGWRLHKDPTGFSVPVPANWTVERERFKPYGPDNVRVYFRDPKGPRMLLIDQTNTPLKDAEADWRRQEAARKGWYSGYQRVKIESVDYGLEAADWEWLFNEDGVRMHVRNRGFVTAKDKGYAIRWDTPASEWDANLANFDIIANGFRPVRGRI